MSQFHNFDFKGKIIENVTRQSWDVINPFRVMSAFVVEKLITCRRFDIIGSINGRTIMAKLQIQKKQVFLEDSISCGLQWSNKVMMSCVSAVRGCSFTKVCLELCLLKRSCKPIYIKSSSKIN